jgi:hypothetical protein
MLPVSAFEKPTMVTEHTAQAKGAVTKRPSFSALAAFLPRVTALVLQNRVESSHLRVQVEQSTADIHSTGDH